MSPWKLVAQLKLTEKDGSESVFSAVINETRVTMIANEMAERGITIMEMESGLIGFQLLPVEVADVLSDRAREAAGGVKSDAG